MTEFFELFSQKSGEPLGSLTHLTFTFLFADLKESTVQQGDEQAWADLKEETVTLFKVSRIRNPTLKKFQVLVEIRDMRSLMADENSMWGI